MIGRKTFAWTAAAAILSTYIPQTVLAGECHRESYTEDDDDEGYRKPRAKRRVVRVAPPRRVIARPISVAARLAKPPAKPVVAQQPIITGSLQPPVVAEIDKLDGRLTNRPAVVAATVAPATEIKAIEQPAKTQDRLQSAVIASSLRTAAASDTGAGEGECRKFLPAAGLVVSVPCGE